MTNEAETTKPEPKTNVIVGWSLRCVNFCVEHKPKLQTKAERQDLVPILATSSGPWNEDACDECGRTLGEVLGTTDVHHHDNLTCPACHYTGLNASAPMPQAGVKQEDRTAPTAGDVTVCMACGEILQFFYPASAPGLRLKRAPEGLLLELDNLEELRTVAAKIKAGL